MSAPRLPRPLFDERTSTGLDRMAPGSMGGNVRSASPVPRRSLRGPRIADITSLTIGGQYEDWAYSDDLTLDAGDAGSENFVWSSTPTWMNPSPPYITTQGLFEFWLQIGTGSPGSLTGIFSIAVAAAPQMSLTFSADEINDANALGLFTLGTIAQHNGGNIIVDGIFYHMFGGADVTVALAVTRLLY